MKLKNHIRRHLGDGYIKGTRRWLELSDAGKKVVCPFTNAHMAYFNQCLACRMIFPELGLRQCPCSMMPLDMVVARAELFIEGEI